jgi:predicted RNA-binding protein associated with RNAse of E/G family
VLSQDYVLDVWVTPDRQTHRKDEHELKHAVEQDLFSAKEADRIRQLAEEAEAAVAGWGYPFSEGWDLWRPNPEWGLPELPANARWEVDISGV